MKQIKKLLFAFLIVILCTFTFPIFFTEFSNPSYSVQAASKIKLNTTKKTLLKGSTYTLKVKGTSKKVKWSSSNKKVATVSSKGKIKAIGKGTTYIKAKVGKKTYSCKVTVETPSISKTKCTIVKGTTYNLSMKGNSQKVTWSSSNKKVATVNSKGKVTAIKKGTATIKAKIGSKTYSCKVTIESPYFSKKSASVNVASSLKNPLKGTSKSISYKSSNSNIVKVDKKGTIYGIKAGTAKITATVSGKSFTYSVTVKKVTSVSGWKTICGTKYYYIKGVPATGLQTINNRKYMFNNNGIVTSKFGIDVSEHQKNIDWAKVKADGVQFAILRCGYGMDGEPDQDDTRFKKNIAECQRLGIPYGVYLFSYADTIEKAESEADHALRLVKGYKPTLGIWYDIEDNSISGDIEIDLRTDIINTFCDKVKSNGYKVGIYANTSWLNQKIDKSITSKYPIWVAQYYSKCEYTGKYAIWQYTSNGAVDGISTKVDYNIMF